jgi:ABC-type Fe3+ transport system substrate-binding protein
VLKSIIKAFVPLLLLVAIPIAMRPKAENSGDADEKIVVLTPHNEAIRSEFGRAFEAHFRQTTGRSLKVEWRTPGGTSDIVRYIDDRFHAAFKDHWLADSSNGPWTATAAGAFNNRKLKLDDGTPEEARRARQMFLASDVGIGADLFFGGGQYEMKIQADKGHAIDFGLIREYPQWFNEGAIPQTFSGETFYDPKGRYFGACLSAFGICYNPDRLAAMKDSRPPERWRDLGEPRFFGQVAVADPTKSGSITRCFEMLIQQQMANAATPAAGWDEGLNLIKRLGGNARYITDSSSKVPRDVGMGSTTAGICIDFYGRTEAEWTSTQSGGKERVVYVTPAGGSSISVDPIVLFRGAPNREAAAAFVAFILSDAGQKLWNYRPGTPGGPRQYALRRLPVRRDMYTDEHRQHMSDASSDPFAEAASFHYRSDWTGRYFGLIRVLVKCMVIDSLNELQSAWRAIVEAGGPEQVPEAMALFNEMPFDYAGCAEAAAALRAAPPEYTTLDVLNTTRGWSDFFRHRYRQAEQEARRALAASR